MVKDVMKDPIFERRRPIPKPSLPLRKDFLLEYKKTAAQSVAFRTRIMTFVGVAVYLFFNFIDQATYPAEGVLFFKMRVFVSLLCLAAGSLCFIKAFQKYSVWVVDFLCTSFGASLALMIYLTDGTSSNYYAGINVTLLGMAVINGFYFWHCLTVCLAMIAIYSVAALASGAALNMVNYFAAVCFMSATAFLAVLLTKFYSAQHFSAFIANKELVESKRKLEVLYGLADERSKIDDLTKIYNRRYFFEILAEKISACKRSENFFYLIIFDIDYFKHINDTYGHVFGDQVIAQVARAVRDRMRLDSYVGRYGGDEFMLIIDRATPNEFFARVRMIRRAISDLRLQTEGRRVEISASFGAAKFDASKGMDERQLIELADNALLEVKRTRRGEIKLAEYAQPES